MVVHKNVRSQRGFVQCGHFSDKGFLQMRTSALLNAKNFGFFEIYGVSAQTRGSGLSQCGHFAGKEGQFFAMLCGRLLWTALTTYILKMCVMFHLSILSANRNRYRTLTTYIPCISESISIEREH